MKLPQHIVIVPDGNRRWARKSGRPSFFGHQKGAKRMEEIVRALHSAPIPYVTVWASSVSNLTKRGADEVNSLYDLYEKYFFELSQDPDILKDRVRIRAIGRWKELTPERVQRAIGRAVEKTEMHTRSHLTFLVGYDGREEMLSALIKLVAQNEQDVSGEVLKKSLWTAELPTVDLVVRTGGDPHWSAGLMMWDVAEARLYFTETLWPDFDRAELEKALAFYGETERREGS